jgi:hypothetical protein
VHIDENRSMLFARMREEEEREVISTALLMLGVDVQSEYQDQVGELRELIYFLQAMQMRAEAQAGWLKNREEWRAKKNQEKIDD